MQCNVFEMGSGSVETSDDLLRLILRPSSQQQYSNAQIGDAPALRPWHPPLSMGLRARFSHPMASLQGTAGFGFWNNALSPGQRGIRLPQALWFFSGAPPYNVPLAPGVPGHGFKAMVIDASRPAFYTMLPFAPLGFLLMRSSTLYRILWPIVQRAMGESEALLAETSLDGWHTYTLRWERSRATFAVDGRTVHVTPMAPRASLSFVAWIDNAFAVATPRGQFALGRVATLHTQWLEIEQLRIESL